MMRYIAECINMEKDVKRPRPDRHMMGPFDNFDEAHKWMELHKEYDTILLHPLHDPYSLPDKDPEITPGVTPSC